MLLERIKDKKKQIKNMQLEIKEEVREMKQK
jgi:hypothetical protein